MQIEIVTIGDELLLGFTLDTNGAHLARELAALGVEVVRRVSVGDDPAAIAAAVREALDRCGAVITTGGLGPTSDDRSREAIAAVFGRALHLDEAILERLRERWRVRGWGTELPESNRAQALIPEGATVLENRHGSAPGLWLEDERGRWVAMLPGVPREMRGMLADTLLPRMRDRARSPRAEAPVIRSRTLRTTGIAESALADQLGSLAHRLEAVDLAYLPGWEGVDLRLTARGLPAADAEAALARGESAVRGAVGKWIYGEEGDDLAAVVLAALRSRGLMLAVAESCTGGMLGARIAAIPGASDVFLGGVIAYENAVKMGELGVRAETLATHGSVSEQAACEMAAGVRAKLGAGVGVSITGIAGPDGGTAEKPVGTVCAAVDVRGGGRTFRRVLVGDREEIRKRATQAALDLVRRAIAPDS
jgi:nicotinamide-nucleotide amidase